MCSSEMNISMCAIGAVRGFELPQFLMKELSAAEDVVRCAREAVYDARCEIHSGRHADSCHIMDSNTLCRDGTVALDELNVQWEDAKTVISAAYCAGDHKVLAKALKVIRVVQQQAAAWHERIDQATEFACPMACDVEW